MATKDLLDKAAILQRDKTTYAIAPHIAGGICDPNTLRKLADGLNIDQAKALAEKVIQYYRTNAKERERMGVFIDRIGWDRFRQDVLGEAAGAREATA